MTTKLPVRVAWPLPRWMWWLLRMKGRLQGFRWGYQMSYWAVLVPEDRPYDVVEHE